MKPVLLLTALVGVATAWRCRNLHAQRRFEDHEPGHMPRVFSFPEKVELGQMLASHVYDVLVQATRDTMVLDDTSSDPATPTPITVAISGGSLPKLLAAGVMEHKDLKMSGVGVLIEWERVHLFFADERLVPLEHNDSNYREVSEKLLGMLPILPENVHKIDPTLSVEDAAVAYEVELEKVFEPLGSPTPHFDLILLGMGPDGHTASLFPGHELLIEDSRLIAPISDSPKPPAERITMTLPLLNHAKHVFFVCTGAKKADALRHVFQIDHLPQHIENIVTGEEHEAGYMPDALEDGGIDGMGEFNMDSMYPAGLVTNAETSLVWFVDDDAVESFIDHLEPCITGPHHDNYEPHNEL